MKLVVPDYGRADSLSRATPHFQGCCRTSLDPDERQRRSLVTIGTGLSSAISLYISQNFRKVSHVHPHLKSESIARLNLQSIALKSALNAARICVIVAIAQLCAAEPIVPSDKLPTSSPWDLKKLSEPPKFEWIDAKSPVRSLYYEGEQFHGQPTRVFAYFASPATLDPKAAKGKHFPAVVLLHGGGGTAFRDWAKLWARRGYAAIAMDLAGHQPDEDKNSVRLQKPAPAIRRRSRSRRRRQIRQHRKTGHRTMDLSRRFRGAFVPIR